MKKIKYFHLTHRKYNPSLQSWEKYYQELLVLLKKNGTSRYYIMEWLFFSYILLFSHSLGLRTLGNRVWTKIYTQIFFDRGGMSMCKVRMKGKNEKGKWDKKRERKWIQLPVISQENAVSYWVIWGISGQVCSNHFIWELWFG